MIEVFNAKPEDMFFLNAAAQKDNHGIICPTHVMKEGEDYVGYLSIAAVPSVFMWLSTQRFKIRDSIRTMKFIEERVRQIGAKTYVAPCQAESPLHPYMEKVGFLNVYNADIFVKGVE